VADECDWNQDDAADAKQKPTGQINRYWYALI
jgi:hypothetical protein